MKTMRTAVVVLLALWMVSGICGCNNREEGKNEIVKFESGFPEAPGDVFTLPEISRTEGTEVVIAGVTRQAGPNDSIIVTGRGFLAEDLKAYIYMQSEKDNGTSYEVNPTVVDDNQVVLSVDKNAAYGVYGVYVEAAGKTSDIWLVNDPKIWWIGYNEVTADDEVSIYGENLTTDNRDTSNVYLLDEGRYLSVEVTYADPYKVTFKVPAGLEDGKKYDVLLHNGHGGEGGFAVTEEKIIYKNEKTTVFKGITIDVTEYGADPADDGADDSVAIQNAVNAAEDGDILYLPEGVYRCDASIEVTKELCFKGAGAGKTKLTMGNEVKDGMFVVRTGPSEFSGLSFYYVLGSGKLKVPFINVEGDAFETAYYNFYLHDCHFEQSTSANELSTIESVLITSTHGILVENNNLAATRFIRLDNCKKVIIRNNTHYGTCFVGPYYSQDAFVVWNTDMMDVSDNLIAAADILSDDSGILDKGDYTQGRTFAIQQEATNLYISNNEFKNGGLPNDNAGEQIMLENIYNLYRGKAQSATENTLTMPDSFVEHVAKNHIFTIVSGTGVTQYRFVESIKGKTITFTEDWDIIPDETSVFLVTSAFHNIVIHNNLITGYKNYAQDSGATCGVQVYGNAHNTYITSNDFGTLCDGICLTSHYENSGEEKATNGIFWAIISDNKISDVAGGIRFRLAYVPKPYATEEQMYTCFGITIRKNVFENIVDYKTENRITLGGYGISYGRPTKEYTTQPDTNTWQGNWEWGSVIENNVFENCVLHNILLCKHQGKTILRNNRVSEGDIYTLENDIAGLPIMME